MTKNLGNGIRIHQCYNMPAVYSVIDKGYGWTVEVRDEPISRNPCRECPWCGEKLNPIILTPLN